MVLLRRRRGVLVLVTLIAAATVSFNVFNALVHHTNDSREQTMVRDVHPRTRRRTTSRTAPGTTLQKYEKFRRPVVLIMSQMRSGSSFAAEIFNQHPGAFYVFEPLWAVSFLSNGTYNSDVWRRDMLTALMTCRFEGLEKFLWFYLNDENFYVFTKSQALLDVCKKFSKPGNITEPCPIPRSVLASVLGRSCHAKNFTVIKTIRVKDIDLIRSTLENIGNEVDLKIIHLVRDPRATIASRMGVFDQGKSYADLNVKNKNYGIYGLCREALRNMQPKSGTSSLLRDRYALVRYEDIIRDITEMAKRLYNFTGVPIHRDVLRWIQLNTNVEDVDGGPFSRKRNAKETANHWRTRLSFAQVRTFFFFIFFFPCPAGPIYI
ncbi:carbohydrate sulfotransferase 3-like [Branchiostoma floridae x Branchiostoma belcheri]